MEVEQTFTRKLVFSFKSYIKSYSGEPYFRILLRKHRPFP